MSTKKLTLAIISTILGITFGQNNYTNTVANNETVTVNFTTLLTENHTNAVGNNETVTVNSTNLSLELICNRTNTCLKQIPSNYSDLITRKCMCDEQCSTYKDCCQDSKYYNKSLEKQSVQYDCLKTPFDGYFYMVNDCPANYKDHEMAGNCTTTDKASLVSDFLLSLPVTDTKTNTTYRNVFCAFCNDKIVYKFWDIMVQYELKNRSIDIITQNSSTVLDTSFYSSFKSDDILLNLKVDKNRNELISDVQGSIFKCEMKANLPESLVSSVRHCRLNNANRECNVCDNYSSNNQCSNTTILLKNLIMVNLINAYLPKGNHCDEIPEGASNENVFCSGEKKKKSSSSSEKKIGTCFYQTNDGRLCLINSFFYPGQFDIIDNETVFVKKYDAKFGKGEWTSQTTIPGAIFVCGTVIPRKDVDKFFDRLNYFLTEVLVKFSILFLILYLIHSAKKEKLQSLPNKIIFSYCATLLVTYTLMDVSELLPTCYISAAIQHYLLLSCFTWLLIASYDFWQVICRSSNKLQTLAGKTRLKRYLTYCLLGWIGPMPLMSVAIYFELSTVDKIKCTLKPGYGRLKQCFIGQTRPANYFYYYPTTVMFSIIIVFFAHTSYHIYQCKRKNIKSTAQNNYYALFAKLALTMGLTWTFGMIVTFTESNILSTIYVIINSSQGTFMFFAYGFKRTMLTKIYEKHKDSAVIQQTKSTFISISDKIRRKSGETSDMDLQTQTSTN